MIKQYETLDSYCKGYAAGFKEACKLAAARLIDEAHHCHVDLSDMKQVSRVAEEIREIFKE
jgi:hypothetical protein